MIHVNYFPYFKICFNGKGLLDCLPPSHPSPLGTGIPSLSTSLALEMGSHLSFQHVPREEEVRDGGEHQAARGDEQTQPPGSDPALVTRRQVHCHGKTQGHTVRAPRVEATNLHENIDWWSTKSPCGHSPRVSPLVRKSKWMEVGGLANVASKTGPGFVSPVFSWLGPCTTTHLSCAKPPR